MYENYIKLASYVATSISGYNTETLPNHTSGNSICNIYNR